MKRNWIFLIMSMVIATMPLMSCDNDDDENTKPEMGEHDPELDTDQLAVTGYDGLDWLQSCIAVVDENGEVIRRIYGQALDESKPTVLSVSVNCFADAEKIFLSWVAPGKNPTKVDGGYDYELTDAKGNAQGSVSLRAVEGENGVIARMSVAEGTNLKQVSEVNFIDHELWPENAEYPIYRTGYTYEFSFRRLYWGPSNKQNEAYTCKPLTSKELFYCIQGNVPGQEAILIWISPDYNEDFINVPGHVYIDCKATKYLPSVAEAQRVLEVFNKMDKSSWDYMLSQMDKLGYQWSSQSGGYTTGDDEFLLNSDIEESFWGRLIKCLDLDSRPGEICDVIADLPIKYRYMHIIVIPASRWELLI